MTRTVRRTTSTLPPVDLTPEQAAAIAIALAAQPDGAFSADGRAALEKVLGALEPDPRRRSQLLATSLWVSAEAHRSAEIRAAVQQAVAERRVLVLRYRDGKGTASQREVEPQLLASGSDQAFLLAWCRERQAPRWFRLDRIEGVRLTAETAPRRDPSLFGAPRSGPAAGGHPAGHPAGRALPRRPDPADPRRGLVVLPGGRE
jgi:predicted DNA-binding transcriptional regulator YafY